MPKVNFIPDGYTITADIKATDFFSSARIEFRPPTQTERQIVFKKIRECENDPAKAEQMGAEATAARLIAWNVTDPSGAAVEITQENLLRLNPHFSNALFDTIFGLQPAQEAADAKN